MEGGAPTHARDAGICCAVSTTCENIKRLYAIECSSLSVHNSSFAQAACSAAPLCCPTPVDPLIVRQILCFRPPIRCPDRTLNKPSLQRLTLYILFVLRRVDGFDWRACVEHRAALWLMQVSLHYQQMISFSSGQRIQFRCCCGFGFAPCF